MHSLRPRPGDGMETQPARETVASERVLYRDRCVYGARDGNEFPWFQSDESAGVSGVVQGFSTPPLLLLIMLMTNSRKIMGKQTNGLGMNILGWITTAAIFSA